MRVEEVASGRKLKHAKKKLVWAGMISVEAIRGVRHGKLAASVCGVMSARATFGLALAGTGDYWVVSAGHGASQVRQRCHSTPEGSRLPSYETRDPSLGKCKAAGFLQ